MKGKILRDIKNQKARKKRLQRERFEQRYNQTRKVEFVRGEDVNMDSFRAIPRNQIPGGLSQAALAVYPVLCFEADFEKDKSFQVSQQVIADYAGVSVPTVKKATEELAAAGLLEMKMATNGIKHFYVYRVRFVRRPMLEGKPVEGGTVYFYTCIIHNGIWARLSLGAKALYLVLRAKAELDLDLYNDIETTGEYYQPIEYDDYIRNRKWDVCHLTLTEMNRLINTTNAGKLLQELEQYRLVERIGKWTKVYLRPGRFIR